MFGITCVVPSNNMCPVDIISINNTISYALVLVYFISTYYIAHIERYTYTVLPHVTFPGYLYAYNYTKQNQEGSYTVYRVFVLTVSTILQDEVYFNTRRTTYIHFSNKNGEPFTGTCCASSLHEICLFSIVKNTCINGKVYLTYYTFTSAGTTIF